MKYLKAVLLIVSMLVAVMLPAFAIVYGLLRLLVEDPGTFMMFALYLSGIIGFMYLIFLLVNNPKTAGPTKFLIGLVIAVAFVKSCSDHVSFDDHGCTPSRYIDCD